MLHMIYTKGRLSTPLQNGDYYYFFDGYLIYAGSLFHRSVNNMLLQFAFE